ncbi:MAG: DUF2069 domain-containing protein [bacterium]
MKGWLFLSLMMVGSLFALTGLRQFFIEPLDDPGVNAAWFLIQMLPLLLPLPGLLRGHLRPAFFMCMSSMLYFIHGVLVVFDPDLFVFGLFEILFSLGLCGATAILVRRIREHEAGLTDNTND